MRKSKKVRLYKRKKGVRDRCGMVRSEMDNREKEIIDAIFIFKQKTAYEVSACLVGS